MSFAHATTHHEYDDVLPMCSKLTRQVWLSSPLDGKLSGLPGQSSMLSIGENKSIGNWEVEGDV